MPSPGQGPTIIDSSSAPPTPSGGGWRNWIPAIVGAAADVGGMLFGKHQADTAHQREVVDLKAAGLNPMLSAMGGRGAAVPDVPSFGSDVHQGLSSAMGMQLQKAQLSLMGAQADQAESSALVNRVNAGQTQQAFGPLQQKRLSDAELAGLNVQQLRDRFPLVLEQLRQDVMATSNNAARSGALAALDKARLTGELNLQKVQEMMGASSPALMEALTILRLLNEARK